MSRSKKYDPEILTATVTSSVATLTPTYKAGTVIIQNTDLANYVYVSWDGTVPVASLGDGRWKLAPGASLNLNLEEIDSVKAICAGADTVDLQCCFWPSCGSDRGA